MNSWPENVDGDVFRRLQDHGFDFSREHTIDFNVDFANWPPPTDAIEQLRLTYSNVRIIEPCEKYSGSVLMKYDGYVLIQINAHLTYELVMDVQNNITALMKPYSGRCESWGVLQQ